MDEVLTRFVENLLGRLSGPMRFRLVLQPIMAILFAARAGIRDAKTGQPPYFWSIFRSPGARRELAAEGWKDVGRVFLVAVILDAVYQFITVQWFYPAETLVVATILAFVPYLLFRGAFTRLARRRGMGIKS